MSAANASAIAIYRGPVREAMSGCQIVMVTIISLTRYNVKTTFAVSGLFGNIVIGDCLDVSVQCSCWQ